jgi:hypothetical protein
VRIRFCPTPGIIFEAASLTQYEWVAIWSERNAETLNLCSVTPLPKQRLDPKKYERTPGRGPRSHAIGRRRRPVGELVAVAILKRILVLRFTRWDPSLSPEEAAAKAGSPIAWTAIATMPIEPPRRN